MGVILPVLVKILRILLLPISLPLGFIASFMAGHNTGMFLTTKVKNGETNEYETRRFGPYYDYQVLLEGSYANIRILLTLGRERLPKNHVSVNMTNFIDFTVDIYCKNEGEQALKISMEEFSINGLIECAVANEGQLMNQEFIVPPGEYVNLPTLYTMSIGLRLDEEFTTSLKINNEIIELTDYAVRMERPSRP